MTAAGRLGKLVAVAAAGFLLSAGSVLAVEAVAKSSVNVRTGPGTTFTAVGKLSAGELVDITECDPSGFCYVDRSGAPDGWVSAQYLTAPDDDAADDADTDNPASSNNKDCSFGFNIGPGGPNLNINCGDNPGPFPPGPGPFPPGPPGPGPGPGPFPTGPSSGDRACFFTGSNFNGQSFCVGVGQTRNFLPGPLNDRISSVRLYGNVRASLCEDPNLNGYCRTVFSNTGNLPPSINDRASSLRVVPVGGPLPPPPPPVPPTPVTYSTGPIDLMQTYEADLDHGNVGGPGSDIWYEAVTATNKFITPRNGARLALGDGSNRGFNGCSSESYSTARISLYDVPVGTYVCVKTSEGRFSQFRVNGFAGTTMKLGYTTWAN